MENTALNGTTITKDQGWKTKKGYSIVAVSLALVLGLSFSAGRRGEVGMTNGVASSSSLSLVGSTASLSKVCKACKNDDNCLKTCTCGKDADCPQWFPPTITTCDQKKCVTHSRSPWDFLDDWPNHVVKMDSPRFFLQTCPIPFSFANKQTNKKRGFDRLDVRSF